MPATIPLALTVSMTEQLLLDFVLMQAETEMKNAAWYYPTPKEKAANIKDYVAFCMLAFNSFSTSFLSPRVLPLNVPDRRMARVLHRRNTACGGSTLPTDALADKNIVTVTAE